jgi:hypothetical protein
VTSEVDGKRRVSVSDSLLDDAEVLLEVELEDREGSRT